MTIDLVSGVEGPCLVANCNRIAGPKPWGGGKVLRSWQLDERHVRDLITICLRDIDCSATIYSNQEVCSDGS